MIKKALLVGSSFSAAPLFFSLKKRGLHVSVCGNNKTDPCHQYADASYFFDYSNRNKLLELVQAEKIDYLISSCNDYALMSCAWVAAQAGLPGYDKLDVTMILHNKSYFRQFTNDNLLPAPRSIQVKAKQSIDAGNLKFPLLVKPVDSFSGRGVSKIMQWQELVPAVDKALKSSSSDEVTVEEFIEGELYSHSAFIQDQKIVFDTFVDEYCTVYPYQVNCSNHPSSLSEELKSSVRVAINQLIEKLELNDGLLHTQFIAADAIWIIECMRRCPGDLYGSLVKFSTGIDYSDLYVRSFLDEKLPLSLKIEQEKYYARHTICSSKPLVNFTFSQNIPAKTVKIVALKSSGEMLDAAPYDKLAILFSEHHDRAEMQRVSPKMADFVSIQTQEGNHNEL